MDQLEFFENAQDAPPVSRTRLIAATLDFQVELIEALSAEDAERIIAISQDLDELFGPGAAFTRKTVRKYFNFPTTLPFVGRLHGTIIGFLVGVPLEYFDKESWAQSDPQFGRHTTIYTYAFVFDENHRKTGYAKMLKRVYLNWLRKKGYLYVAGHVLEGVVARHFPNAQVLQRFPNWRNTGKVFEFYRRPLG